MSEGTDINYEAVLADLEGRKVQLETAIAAIRGILGQAGSMPPGGTPTTPSGAPAHDAFIGLSIPEATKKHLSTARRKQSTQEVMEALEAGGLPHSKYNTVYSTLRRREKQIGDIINMMGDWALAAWFPNYNHRKKAAKVESEEKDQGSEQSSGEDSSDSQSEQAKVKATA